MKAPNRLKLVDGHLTMIDGSDPAEYLRCKGLDHRDVVVVDREQYIKLLDELDYLRLFYGSVAA